jgi:hypothetical protein
MQKELDMLRKQLAEKDAIIARQQQRLSFLEEQFRLAQQKRFGVSSEGHPGQGELFNEAEELVAEVLESEKETISYTRNKPKRKSLPADLPREVVVHDIDDADKVCDCCDNALHKIGEDKSEKLEFIPAQVKVIEHVRPKYACRHCEKNGTSATIKQAPVPMSIIPKGYAIRQDKALPLLEQFTQWLIKSEQSVLPKTKLGEAITYCINQWAKLTVYPSDGRLNIDNNRAERAIKPFVIGRKNWLFSNTAKGADASAILYSIIETAKANGLTPFDYVMNVLTHISHGDVDVEKLLPWNKAPS